MGRSRHRQGALYKPSSILKLGINVIDIPSSIPALPLREKEYSTVKFHLMVHKPLFSFCVT